VSDRKNSVIGKLIRLTIVSALVEGAIGVRLRGTKKQLESVAAALKATHSLKEELESPTATVESIVESLRAKHAAALIFESEFGVDWPL
jgi:hypothetical protein